jgi:uncharacterized membrane protein YdjX (TVP38/TMEM64 family)
MFHSTEPQQLTVAPAQMPPAPAAPVADGCFRRWAKRLGPAGPLAAIMVCLPVVGGLVLLGFIRQLAPWLKAHASVGTVVLAAATFAGMAGFSLVPTYVLEIVAGWVFGPTVGLITAMAGLTAAATISYSLAHLIVREQVAHSIHDNPKCEAVRQAMLGRGAVRTSMIVALLRMAPVVPFGATNLLMASAECPVGPFVVGTAVGTLPRTAAIVFMASQMAELKFTDQPGVFVAGLVATVFVVTILGYLAKRALAQVTGVVDREIARDAAP